MRAGKKKLKQLEHKGTFRLGRYSVGKALAPPNPGKGRADAVASQAGTGIA